jgi:threonine aldolase
MRHKSERPRDIFFIFFGKSDVKTCSCIIDATSTTHPTRMYLSKETSSLSLSLWSALSCSRRYYRVRARNISHHLYNLHHHHHRHHHRHHHHHHSIRYVTSSSTASIDHSGHCHRRIVDLRSDTVTSPSQPMLQTALHARTGDDVLGEDTTVQELEHYVADQFGKECGVYVPTGTMANLIAIMAHCNVRSSEILIGAQSHISLWEAGNVAGLASVYTKSIQEDVYTGQFDVQQIRNMTNCTDSDAHQCRTQLLCLENTHNMLGGIALPIQYMNDVGSLCHNELHLKIHLDGARICNAAIALNVSVKDLCHVADTVSICLSKGLGAPMGSVLVGEREIIRLAKRARKRCGGGMRQAGVVAAMGLYALQNNYHRLHDDHIRAKRLATTLQQNGFPLMRDGQVDTNIVYFKLPDTTIGKLAKDEFCIRLFNEYGVKVTGGYTGSSHHGNDNNGGRDFFRAVTHLDVNDDDIDYASDAMVQLCYK